MGKRWPLGVVLAAVAVAFADSSIVVLALPDMLSRFDTSITSVAWVVTAYNLAVVFTALMLVPVVRRLDPIRLVRFGLVIFLASSVACGFSTNLPSLIAFRSVQGVGGALLLVGTLPLARALANSADRGTALWIGAGIVGASVGPAAGGLLTEMFSWEAIFFAQAPVAAAALTASFRLPAGLEPTAAGVEEPGSRGRRWSANAAVALASASLVGLLFLSVLLLINIWGFAPLGAAAAVSVIPLATLAAQPVARTGSVSTAGFILLGAGLAGMAFLPEREIAWVLVALALAGFGLGLALATLTQSALAGSPNLASAGATTVTARHAGLVLGLLILTPLLAGDLSDAGRKAKLQATGIVLDAPLTSPTKLNVAIDLIPVLSHPSQGVPDFSESLAARQESGVTALGRRLDSVVRATLTRSFRHAYLVATLLALLAVIPFLFTMHARTDRRSFAITAIALGVAFAGALIGTELARGAAGYGTQPRIPDACSTRPPLPARSPDRERQQKLLKRLDTLACVLHKSREQLIVDLASSVGGLETIARYIREAG
jgi:predicted MFS family arabinose efflux permease